MSSDIKQNTPAEGTVQVDLAEVLPQNKKSWLSQWHLLRLNFSIAGVLLLSSSIGYDGSLMNALQILPQWNSFMHHPVGSRLGLINALYWIGLLIAFPITPFISTKYGRKPGVYMGFVFLVLGAAMQTAAQNDTTFIVSRLFVGAAAGFWAVGAPLLINEIAYPTHRAIASALFMCGFYVGAVVAAWVTYGIRNSTSSWGWRLPSILQVLCPLLSLPGLVSCPESPRWMIASDKPDAARAMLVKYHAGGDDISPLVDYEMIEIQNTIRMERESHASTSYLDMVKTKGNRHRLFITVTLAFFSQWVGNNVVSYYLTLILDSVGITSAANQLLIAGCLQIWNLLFAVAAASLVEKLGRRTLFLISAAVTLISYIIITGLSASFAESGNSTVGVAVVPFLFIFFAGYDIALTPLLVAYPAEIWPYRLRSRGLTLSWLTGIASIIFMTFVSPVALASIAWKYYIVFLVVLVFYGITVYLTYPETRGHTLEQMAIIFDGDEAETQAPKHSIDHLEHTMPEKGFAHEV